MHIFSTFKYKTVRLWCGCIQILWPTVFYFVVVSLVLFDSAVTPVTALHSVYDKYVDMHNYGYIFEHKREMSIATYDAKLFFTCSYQT